MVTLRVFRLTFSSLSELAGEEAGAKFRRPRCRHQSGLGPTCSPRSPGPCWGASSPGRPQHLLRPALRDHVLRRRGQRPLPCPTPVRGPAPYPIQTGGARGGRPSGRPCGRATLPGAGGSPRGLRGLRTAHAPPPRVRRRGGRGFLGVRFEASG